MTILEQKQIDSIIDIGIRVTKTVTFAGATPNAIGDIDGTSNPYTLFTVTGVVAVRVVGHCTTLLADAGASGTVSVGIPGNVASLIALTASNNIDANEIWIDATPATVMSLPGFSILVNGTDIQLNCATDNTNSGVIVFYCTYIPISSDGLVT